MRPIKIFSAICLIGLAVIFTNSCSKGSSYGSSGGGVPGTNLVTIQSMQFQPATITLVAGSTITWKNMDAVAHTVTSDDGTSFDSGNISPQGTYTFTFMTVGSYPYHCSIHPSEKGTVQIVVK